MPAARISPANIRSDHPLVLQDSVCSSGSESVQESTEEDGEDESMSPYQKVLDKLRSDERWHKEITLGRRIGFYRIKEELGSGNFSQVRAAVHALTRERVAVKILDKSKLDNKTHLMLSREISSMENLHHPHIIRLYEVMETLSKIYLVMEHASGGELFHKISQNGRFSEKAARPLFAQITAAVDHMHFHHIVHRDLKAENVFFSGPNTVKVGDFGFSTHIRDKEEPLRTFCGSPPYAAPELFRDDSYVGPMVDVWALGVLLYFMLTASMPFKAQTVSGLKKQILDGDFSIPEYIGSDSHFLIVGILKQDPKQRTPLEQIKNSNWLTGQILPKPLPKDKLQLTTEDCNGNGTIVSTVESSVKQTLLNLGISSDMVEEAKERGSRSSVIGTYRIILHRCLTQAEVAQAAAFVSDTSKFLKASPKKKKKNRKSKMCIIL